MKALWLFLFGMMLGGSFAFNTSITPVSFLSIPTSSDLIAGVNGVAYNNSIYTEIHPNFTLYYYQMAITGPTVSNFLSAASIKGITNVSNVSLFLANNTRYNSSFTDPDTNITTITDSTNFTINTTPSKLKLGNFVLVVMVSHPNGNIGIPTQEFNLTQGGLDIDPTISACGAVTSGVYTITQNLASTTATACLNVTGADTSIDGQNFNITGNNTTSTTGIYVQANGVNISNVKIANYTYGIQYNGGNSGNVNNVTINSSFAAGAAIYLPNANLTVINGSSFNTSSDNDVDIFSDGTVGANNITVANSTLFTSGTVSRAIRIISNSANWTIFNNTISTTISTGSSGGIISNDVLCAPINITKNTINISGISNPISVFGLNDTISGNTIRGASGTAIAVTSCNGTTISNNIATSSGSSITLNACNRVIVFNNTLNASGASVNGIFLLASTSNFTNITFNTINVSGPSAIGINITSTASQPGSNIIANNTIWVNASSPGVGIKISIKSGNNSIYYNNFTSGFYFINSTNNTNTFNTTVSGDWQGNQYANITTYRIYSTDGDNWGDVGLDYPVNATKTPGIFTADSNGSDNGPWTTARTAWVKNWSLSNTSADCTAKVQINLTCESDNLSVCTANITGYKNGAAFTNCDANITVTNNTAYIFNCTLNSSVAAVGDNFSWNVSVNDSLATSGPNQSSNFTIASCGGGGGSGLFCQVLTSNYGALIWQTVVAGNILFHHSSSPGGDGYWGVWTQGSGAWVLNYTTPYGAAVWVKE